MVSKEKDDELALFLEVRRREKDREAVSLGGNNGSIAAPPTKVVLVPHPTRKTAADKFLDSENGKSDYDWLITPPGTPLVPSVEMNSQKTKMNKMSSNTRSNALQLKMINVQEENVPKDNITSKNRALPTKTNSAIIGSRRSTSIGEPMLKTRPRPVLPSSLPSSPMTLKSSRSSTPTPRATLASIKPVAAARSSTPTRSIPRSSTPTSRSSECGSKTTARSATPTRLQSNASAASSNRVQSVPKSASAISSASRGSSPTVRCRPRNPNELPCFSLEAPPNLKTAVPVRSASATRGRLVGASNHTSNDARPNPWLSRQSPGRRRTTNGSASDNKLSIFIKSTGKCNDDVNPVLMGTKMVERVVNMRKLVPPRQDDSQLFHSNSAGKCGTLDASGFGRTLSKTSLDMALRHMDIRHTFAPNGRPLITHLPASSVCSVRSGGSTKDWRTSGSWSPHATRSIDSTESSAYNHTFLEIEDGYCGSEKGTLSPSHSRQGIE